MGVRPHRTRHPLAPARPAGQNAGVSFMTLLVAAILGAVLLAVTVTALVIGLRHRPGPPDGPEADYDDAPPDRRG